MTFRHLGDESRLDAFLWNVVSASFESPAGERFERDIVRSPGSVGVVPLLAAADTPTVRLVQQYRPALDREIIEIPAGMRDVPGEPTIDTARRELVEEVGLDSDDLRRLIELHPSPGMTDAVCSVYLARHCRPVPTDRQGIEEHYMRVLDVPLDEAVALVERNEITDAKSVAGLMLAARTLAR